MITRNRLHLILFVSSLVAAIPSTAAAQSYRLTELGTLGGNVLPAAINNRGDIVGNALTTGGERHAFLWSDEVFTDLGMFGGEAAQATDISDAGHIIVYVVTISNSGVPNQALLLKDNVVTSLGVLDASDRGTFPAAINPAGEIVGYSMTLSNNNRAFVFRDGAFTPLPLPININSVASNVNNSGDVVGRYNPSQTENPHGFLVSQGTFWDLGSFIPNAINTSGDIVGPMAGRPFFKDDELIDLGVSSGSAFALNSRGQSLAFGMTVFQRDHACSFGVEALEQGPLS